MSIWTKTPTVTELNSLVPGNMLGHLGIEFTAVDERGVEGTMPVDERTWQPFGRLHGGASVALAESLGSAAANFCVDPVRYYCVGLGINSNHVGSVKDGIVLGRAEPIHLGRSTQVWEVRVSAGTKLVSVHRLTLSVLER